MISPKIKLTQEQTRRVKQIAETLNIDVSHLLEVALEDTVNDESVELDKEILIFSKRLSDLTKEHAPLASKVASLTFKYSQIHSACANDSILVLGLEAEKRTLCRVLGMEYDDSLKSKEERMFDRYHSR
ncbi:MAG: hypothetical protein QXQ39_00950 [Conexivisphaerales archaeon]